MCKHSLNFNITIFISHVSLFNIHKFSLFFSKCTDIYILCRFNSEKAPKYLHFTNISILKMFSLKFVELLSKFTLTVFI